MSAAPRAIAKNATIVDQSGKEGGEMPVLRKGMNDWTCMPDDPSTPANDPMCLDKNAVDWAKAWKSHTEPKLSGAGMGYMLQGGGSPSNTDPFATKPAEGKKWHTRCFGKTVSRLILATSAAMSGTRPQRSYNQGIVIGFANTAPGIARTFEAFIWTQADGMKPLGMLPGDLRSEALGYQRKRPGRGSVQRRAAPLPFVPVAKQQVVRHEPTDGAWFALSALRR